MTIIILPFEPDDAMLEAGNEVLQDGKEWGKRQSAAEVYAAMRDAAPSVKDMGDRASALVSEIEAERDSIHSNTPAMRGVRMGLTLAMRIVQRGRRLTATERLGNLRAFIADDDDALSEASASERSQETRDDLCAEKCHLVNSGFDSCSPGKCALSANPPVQSVEVGPTAFPYQRTFNAIAAATKIEGGHISISVTAFKEAFAATPDKEREDLGDRANALFPFLERANDCFEAALAEGLLDALANGDIDRIRDLHVRRLAFAYTETQDALSTLSEASNASGPSKSPKETRDAVIEGVMAVLRSCPHDGGFDRELGPIGCYLGDKCVCIGIANQIKSSPADIGGEQ